MRVRVQVQVAVLATTRPAATPAAPGRVHAFAHSGGQLRMFLGGGTVTSCRPEDWGTLRDQ